MTLLGNVKERLSAFFTLRIEKDDVWLGYLKEEVEYINGGVYLHTNAPVYHKQKVSGAGFKIDTTERATCYILVDDGSIPIGQANGTYAKLNGDDIIVNPYIENGVLNVELDNTLNGLLKIFVPPYNGVSHQYQGFQYEEEIRSQTLDLTAIDLTDNNSKVNVVVTVGGGVVGQEVKFFTLYRDGTVHFTQSKFLTAGQTTVSVTGLSIGNQDEGVRIDLKPIKKEGIYYMGKSIMMSFSVG